MCYDEKSEDIGVEGSLESSSFDDETQYSAIILGLREKLSDCERNMIHLLQFLRWNITGMHSSSCVLCTVIMYAPHVLSAIFLFWCSS